MKNIVVTGCNRGIGYGIVQKLLESEHNVIMACRNVELAKKARENLLQ